MFVNSCLIFLLALINVKDVTIKICFLGGKGKEKQKKTPEKTKNCRGFVNFFFVGNVLKAENIWNTLGSCN